MKIFQEIWKTYESYPSSNFNSKFLGIPSWDYQRQRYPDELPTFLPIGEASTE